MHFRMYFYFLNLYITDFKFLKWNVVGHLACQSNALFLRTYAGDSAKIRCNVDQNVLHKKTTAIASKYMDFHLSLQFFLLLIHRLCISTGPYCPKG